MREDKDLVVPPGEVLDKARAAAKAENHAEALLNYELFFDRALLDQGENHNYNGVRLSYCLDEWVRLGAKYPPAQQRLEAKAAEAIAAFESTSDVEKFHDFLSISDHLKQEDAAFARFLEYHRTNPALAKLAVRFMWNRLVDMKRWDICSAYLSDAELKYGQALNKFDRAMEVCLADPSLGGDEFADQIQRFYVRDVRRLLEALRSTGQADAAARLHATVVSDMQTRGYPNLIAQVDEQAASGA